MPRAPAKTKPSALPPSPISELDLHLFNEGSHFRLYEKLGAHPCGSGRKSGAHFAVWAPNARQVSVIADFNGWDRQAHPLKPRGSSGIWEAFVPGAPEGSRYKYFIQSQRRNYQVEKADPFARYSEAPPRTASVLWKSRHEWRDQAWMAERGQRNSLDAPISIYEMHLGSWRRVPEEGNCYLGYRELAPLLIEHLARCGFTHVEFLPVMEHPFYGSWGYQCTGYFAPTARYGDPDDFKELIDRLHQAGFGVVLDWVPSHFPSDEHGLAYFDGTHLFEHEDPRQGFHPDWNSYIFNYGRKEVQSFLISSALYWLDEFHADGLRVDAVASMLYLDYSRKAGEWIPNAHGGRENLEAIEFLKRLNTEVYQHFPGTQTFAEESTSWPAVSRPSYVGGLGFGLKWDMGWMHDTLRYLHEDPIHRRYHHHELTFRMLYAFQENFILPLSHDEVVHGKGSLLEKMPGDVWQRFANLRLLYGYLYAQPGKKLLFMGGEFGQWREWNHESSLDWHLLELPFHQGLQAWIRDLNRIYREHPGLHDLEFEGGCFEWLDANDTENSVLSFIRRSPREAGDLLILCNFTPVPRFEYKVGMTRGGAWKELLNSDALAYGGSGLGNWGKAESMPQASHGRPCSLSLTLPPLSVLFFKHLGGQA